VDGRAAMSGAQGRWRDVGAMDATFWELRQTCALGRVLDIGCGAGQFVQRLVEMGVDAYGADANPETIQEADVYTPGRCLTMNGASLPFADAEFETVTCLDWLTTAHDADIDQLAAEIRRVASRHVFLRVSSDPKTDTGYRFSRNRDWWDARFIAAGFRRHPALLRVVDYSAIDRESGSIVLLYERIADIALEAYPLAALAAERDLHMDMLREAGRRSDAHLQRYAAAARLVRPNDVVLDVACGLGYGLATMGATGRASKLIGIDNSAYAIAYARTMYDKVATNVQFRQGDAHQLDHIADHSVDLVVSFETVEHLDEPQAFLASVARVLRPGGRFIASVPNEWLDETGRDPNPHHRHVFDAGRFLALFDAPLLVEHVFAETAGGGMKVLRDPVRAWWRVDRECAREQSAEWWIVVAMKDPRAGVALPYVETVHAVAVGAHRPAAVSYGDAYDNPWLRNAIVTHGIRVSDPRLLAALARTVEDHAIAGSVDEGAAICVLGYQQLSGAEVTADETAEIVARIEGWLAAAGSTTHHFRWRVSLEFLAGLISLRAGRRDVALHWFERCAGRSALIFSPLLATKTVEAAFMAGFVHASSRNLVAARHWWSQGLRNASEACAADWREVIGDPDRPFAFGLRELGQVVDQAARCAAGLNALANWDSAPGRLAELLLNDSSTDRHRLTELMTSRRIRQHQGDAPPARRSQPPAQIVDVKAVSRLREELRDSSERLQWLRASLGGRASQQPRRIVIAGAGETGQRLWEVLAPLGTVDIVGFVDADARTHGRVLLGVTIHPPQWLQHAEWDHIALPESRADEWRFALAKAGVHARQVLEFPVDGTDLARAAAAAAEEFPDPLAGVLAALAPASGLRVGIFGTGAAGLKVWEALAGIDTADAIWFADNNAKQQGSIIFGLNVISPADIAGSDADLIVIGSMSREPILKQLIALGVRPEAILTPNAAAPVDELRRDLASTLIAATLEQVS